MQGLKLGDEEEQADFERAIALSLADNGLATQTEESPPDVQASSSHDDKAPQDLQPSRQAGQSFDPSSATSEIASASHNAAPIELAASRASGADPSSVHPKRREDGSREGQPGDAFIDRPDLEAAGYSIPLSEVASPPQPSEEGPSSERKPLDHPGADQRSLHAAEHIKVLKIF